MSSDEQQRGFGTRAIKAATHAPRVEQHPAAVPIYQSATFHAQDVDDYAALVGFERPGYTYSRLENPTADALAAAFAEMHGAEAGYAFGSGMGAIHATLVALVRAGDRTWPESLRRDLQMVFQDPFASLNPHMRLMDQVAEPLRNYKICSGSDLQERVAQLFDRVELPRSFMRRFPHELSGGEQQRVAIARAFITDPAILFADEPTGNLDEETAGKITELLFSINKELGTSLVMVTHNLQLAAYTGRILKLKGGKIMEDKAVTV